MRGLQITGHATLQRGEYLGLNLINLLELLQQPPSACLSAVWFWASRRLSSLTETGKFQTFMCCFIGGINGLARSANREPIGSVMLNPDWSSGTRKTSQGIRGINFQ